MFVNLATENILLHDQWWSHVIPFRNVEEELNTLFIQSYKKDLPDKIYVLNWPWSFTNLRVWCLVLNTLMLLKKHDTNLYVVNKIELYTMAVKNWLLPRYGYIFIWQRKNVWYYDFVEQAYTVYSKDELANIWDIDSKHCFIDDFVWQDFIEYFGWCDNHVSLSYKDDEVILQYWDNVYHITQYFSYTESIQPYYAMEPNIW